MRIIIFRIFCRLCMLFLFSLCLLEIAAVVHFPSKYGIEYSIRHFWEIQHTVLQVQIRKAFLMVLLGDFIGGSFFRYIYDLKEDDSRR